MKILPPQVLCFLIRYDRNGLISNRFYISFISSIDLRPGLSLTNSYLSKITFTPFRNSTARKHSLQFQTSLPNALVITSYTLLHTTPIWTHCLHEGKSYSRAMDQSVSHRPLTTEARVRARVSPCWICGEQSSTGTGSPRSSIFYCSYHSTVVVHTHVSSEEWIIVSVAAVLRHSRTTSTWTTIT
jgi:hypothetical protein